MSVGAGKSERGGHKHAAGIEFAGAASVSVRSQDRERVHGALAELARCFGQVLHGSRRGIP